MSQSQKIVLITGASSGIGKATALLAAKSGWGIIVAYRRNEIEAKKVSDSIAKVGGWAFPIHLPLEDLKAMDSALSLLETKSILLNALVLSGSPTPVLSSFLKTTPDQLEEQWKPLIMGNHHLMAESWKRFFRKAGKGTIVTVLSEAMGPPPWPHMSAYVTARAALQSLLECALAEFGTGGLRASAVSPDYTDTPMLSNVHEHILEAAKAKRSRFLSPEEVATAIVQQLENPPTEPVLFHQSIKAAAAV